MCFADDYPVANKGLVWCAITTAARLRDRILISFVDKRWRGTKQRGRRRRRTTLNLWQFVLSIVFPIMPLFPRAYYIYEKYAHALPMQVFARTTSTGAICS